MSLADNIITLKKINPVIWERLKKYEEKINDSNIQVVMSKKDIPTIMIKQQEREMFLHSKYDPINEAKRFIEQYTEEEMEKYDHIFFYGLGMGYHVEELMKKYPNKSFTMYEPNPIIFYQYIVDKNLGALPIKMLKNIFVEEKPEEVSLFLNHFITKVSEKTLFVILPSYERVFSNQYQAFLKEFIQKAKDKRTSMNVNLAFEERWTLNSVINFSNLLKTPNILHDFDKNIFKNKPALLVSAGPSLNEEIENIRYIKENGLAYIFTVGSAINALVNNNIYPDATCVYDPTYKMQFIYKNIIEKNIDTIPLIYGSSVGFETVKIYPGPKIHMIVNQDTISPYYLSYNNEKNLNIVSDAPSIAVVTLELLAKLGFNPIILVGQNLSFKNNEHYAKGISDDESIDSYVKEQIKNNLVVEDVYGGKVFTDDAFNRMRRQMELHIKTLNNYEIINTTKGGAKIAGAHFIPLDKVLEERLTKSVVNEKWFTSEKGSNYSKTVIIDKKEKMEDSYHEFIKVLEKAINLISDIDNEVKKKNKNSINKLFLRHDEVIKEIQNNLFYKVFISPMNRVRYEVLNKSVEKIRNEMDPVERGKRVTKAFGLFLNDCRNALEILKHYYCEMHNSIENYVKSTN